MIIKIKTDDIMEGGFIMPITKIECYHTGELFLYLPDDEYICIHPYYKDEETSQKVCWNLYDHDKEHYVEIEGVKIVKLSVEIKDRRYDFIDFSEEEFRNLTENENIW